MVYGCKLREQVEYTGTQEKVFFWLVGRHVVEVVRDHVEKAGQKP